MALNFIYCGIESVLQPLDDPAPLPHKEPPKEKSEGIFSFFVILEEFTFNTI
jgi:hypothetical protein